jgi:hypothetical protein
VSDARAGGTAGTGAGLSGRARARAEKISPHPFGGRPGPAREPRGRVARTFHTAPPTRPRLRPMTASEATYTLAAAGWRGEEGGEVSARNEREDLAPSRRPARKNPNARVGFPPNPSRGASRPRESARGARDRVRTVAEVLNRPHLDRRSTGANGARRCAPDAMSNNHRDCCDERQGGNDTV